jgi:hypothetical protein
MFSHEPLVCLNCETAISCSDCFQQWKLRNRNKPVCPLCKNDRNEPKKLMKYALSEREEIEVKCPNE